MSKLNLITKWEIKHDHASDESVDYGIMLNMKDFIDSGLAKIVKGNDFKLLVVLSHYMDKQNEAMPTQRQIAEITGMSTKTINTSIKNLLSLHIDGKPLITRTLIPTTTGESSVYKINDFEVVVDAEVKAKNIKIERSPEEFIEYCRTTKINEGMTTPDFLKYFKCRYETHYGIPCKINYQAYSKGFKSTFMDTMTGHEILKMLDYVIDNYESSRWKNTNYPYPTIGAIISWLGMEAVKQMKVVEKERQREAEAKRREKEISDSWMNDLSF